MLKISKSQEQEILEEATKLLQVPVKANEFTARFFGPDGKLQALTRTEEERKQLVSSSLYKKLQGMVAELRAKESRAFDEELDEIQQLSGRLTVIVPKSLHAALKDEARGEGISLAELIRLKLNISYRAFTKTLSGNGGPDSPENRKPKRHRAA